MQYLCQHMSSKCHNPVIMFESLLFDAQIGLKI